MDKVLSFLGLCKKAGKLVSGTELVLDSVRNNKSCLVIIANDISELSEKTIKKTLMYYKAEYVKYATKSELGKALGLDERAVISVNDKGFADSVKDKIYCGMRKEG